LDRRLLDRQRLPRPEHGAERGPARARQGHPGGRAALPGTEAAVIPNPDDIEVWLGNTKVGFYQNGNGGHDKEPVTISFYKDDRIERHTFGVDLRKRRIDQHDIAERHPGSYRMADLLAGYGVPCYAAEQRCYDRDAVDYIWKVIALKDMDE